MGTLFGTDGIRGVANTYPMNAETALAIGRAAAYICKRHENRHHIVIGKDTRLSGYMIENALTAGICSMGVDVLLVGPLPTPGIAFITQSMRADTGIVISASHNAFQDNGIKIFSGTGYKLSDEQEAELEDLVESGRINDIRPTADEVGKAYRIDDALGRYIVFCKNTFPEHLNLEGLNVVMDCANGATYKVAPIIFNELGANVIAIHNTPTGENINLNCGSQFTDDLSKEILKQRADVGLAFDGDGDRLIMVDENGREINGDQMIGICALYMKKSGKLKGDKVILTPMSNIGLRLALEREGISHEDANVGDRNVLVLMQKTGARLGGEASGHIIFADHHRTGDGIISALQILAIMKETGKTLSELASFVKMAPQELLNVKVSSKPDIDDIPGLTEAMKAAETELGREGRILVRYSGTEKICRVMVEATTDDMVRKWSSQLATIVRNAIG